MLLAARVPYVDADHSAHGLGPDLVRQPDLPRTAVYCSSSSDLKNRYGKEEVLVHIENPTPTLQQYLADRGYWTKVAMTRTERSSMETAYRRGDKVALEEYRAAYKGAVSGELTKAHTVHMVKKVFPFVALLGIEGALRHFGWTEFPFSLAALTTVLDDDCSGTNGDDFHNRAASATGDWWNPSGTGHFDVQSNEMERGGSGHRIAMYKDPSVADYTAQKITATLRSTNRSVGIATRIDRSASGTHYFHWASGNTFYSSSAYLTGFTVVANLSGNWDNGEVASCEWDSTDGYTIVVAGSTIGTGTDSTYAQGVPGVQMSVSGCRVDDVLGEVDTGGGGGGYAGTKSYARIM